MQDVRWAARSDCSQRSCGEPAAHPFGGAAVRELVALRVERDQVPAADVEAVVALVALAGRAVVAALAVEVVEVAARVGRRVLVVADARAG